MGNARRVKRKSCTLHLAFLLITVEMEKWQFYFYFKGGEIKYFTGKLVSKLSPLAHKAKNLAYLAKTAINYA
jgi:hypothetical protein